MMKVLVPDGVSLCRQHKIRRRIYTSHVISNARTVHVHHCEELYVRLQIPNFLWYVDGWFPME